MTKLDGSPGSIRQLIRYGALTGTTAGLAPGYAQANLVVLPKNLAFDFLLFCQRNPKSCPVLDVTEPGSTAPPLTAPGANLATDIPLYRVYRRGELVEEPVEVCDYWYEDMVAFLLGCSFTFERALLANGIPVRHQEEGVVVPMYRTNIRCRPAGVFSGPMVVSMRPIPAGHVPRAVQVTSRFPAVHGAPVHIGDPAAIGIDDVNKPDFGHPVTIKEGEVPVFWACGVTPQAVAMECRPDLMITHSPGHMFITDLRDEELGVL